MKPTLKILFLTRYPNEGASSRYRVYQYLPYLESMGVSCTSQSFMNQEMYELYFSPGSTLRKMWFFVRALTVRLNSLRGYRQYDIVFMQRELFPIGPPVIERYLRKKGVKLIFDYDDALFINKPSRYNPLATFFRSPDKILKIFGLVDCVVAGNDWLRDKALDYGVEAVTVEVAEDTQRIQMHETHRNDSPITIGWLGSRSTVKYLTGIAPVLRKISSEYNNLVFELVGGGEFYMKGVPWQISEWSLDGELDALARFDIGLMPLPEETWSKGKSGGKARTYMAAGVVPVCTGYGYNSELITDKETGFLCNSDSDWYAALSSLIESAEFRQTIAVKARSDVELRFSPVKQAQALKNVFDSVCAPSLHVCGSKPTSQG